MKIYHCPISKKELFTYESNQNCNFDYYGDNNALSEDKKSSGVYAIDYEVFEVQF